MPEPDATSSTSMLGVGKIISAHGIAGAVKTATEAESWPLFYEGRRVFLQKGESGGWFTLDDAHRAGRFGILHFAGIADRNRAEELAGSLVFVDRADLPALEEGEYYWADIIGLNVVSVSGESLGKVESIIETGANDVYVVKDESGREILLPALEWVIVKVDLSEGLMVVDPPEGL